MKKNRFTASNLEKIEQTVRGAERKTSGEIATAYIRYSYDYAKYELLFGITCGFIYCFLAIFFFDRFENIFRNMSWDYSVSQPLTFLFSSTFIIIFACYLLANIKWINRRIVPKSVKKKRVRDRALMYFAESGIYNTKDRTGILLLISELEQEAVLLADTGISEKIPQDRWNDIIHRLVSGIKSRILVKALCSAIEDCGKLLAAHFPADSEKPDEIQDSISLLEK